MLIDQFVDANLIPARPKADKLEELKEKLPPKLQKAKEV